VGRALAALLPPEVPLVVACSGGPDSTALLIALSRVHRGPIVAAYFDHRWRPAADATADRRFVAALAALAGVEVAFGAAPAVESDVAGAGGGPEAAARAARYRWLAAVCRARDARHLAAGHTRDDQAETVLLRLARGSGLAGAAAMLPLAPWPLPTEHRAAENPPAAGARPGDALVVVRPLLDEGRDAVAAYLRAVGVEARVDPTNAALDFDRNRVRHRVLPQLRRLNPRAAEALARFAAQAAADEALLAAQAAAARDALRPPPGSAREDAVCLDRRALAALPPPLAGRALRLAAGEVGLAPDYAQVAQILGALGRSGAQTHLRGGRAWTQGAWLHLAREPRASRDAAGAAPPSGDRAAPDASDEVRGTNRGEFPEKA